MLDAFDGQISSKTTLEEVGRCNLNLVHPLTGPVFVKGAEPGDILEVFIHDIVPEAFGYTIQVPGFGFLRDVFTAPHIIRWTIVNGYATSADLPGVRVPGAPFMGVIGTAPSQALLDSINRRETDLKARGGAVLLPDSTDAVPRTAGIASSAIRTVSPHECGGNLDIKQLSAGTTLRVPVYTQGALFSVGDAHFAQGDNESCGTAIEMGATFFGSFKVIKGEASRRGIRDVQFYRNDYFTSPEIAVPRAGLTWRRSATSWGRGERRRAHGVAKPAASHRDPTTTVFATGVRATAEGVSPRPHDTGVHTGATSAKKSPAGCPAGRTLSLRRR